MCLSIQILVVILYASLVYVQTVNSSACPKVKFVSAGCYKQDSVEEIYDLIEKTSKKLSDACHDNCLYSKQGSNETNLYCFQEGDICAGFIESI